MTGTTREDPSRGRGSWIGGAAAALAILGTVVFVASLTISKVSNNDIWIHLRTGRLILEGGHLPVSDPYSFTANDRPYVVHEWLSQVIFYLVYAAAGVNGLILSKCAIILATCAALAQTCRFLKVRQVLVLPCIALMALVGSSRFLERPHIFSYLFVALYLMCYFGFRETGRKRIWLYAIPVLDIIWTNLHGGYVQGILLLLVLAAAEALASLRARWNRLASDTLSPGDLGLVAILPLVCVLSSMANPLGYRLLVFPFKLPTQEFVLATIFEWKPLLDPVITHTTMYFYYLVWVALLIVSFVGVTAHLDIHGRPRKPVTALTMLSIFLWVAAVGRLASAYRASAPSAHPRTEIFFWTLAGGLFVLANFHRLELHHAGIAALFVTLSLRSNRWSSDAVIATMPSLAHNLSFALDSLQRRLGRTPAWLKPAALAAAGVAMLGFGIVTFKDGFALSFDPIVKREGGFGVAANVPGPAVDYIVRNGISGNCAASMEFASLVIFRTWPAVKVSMDSRLDVYGEALSEEFARALRGGADLQAYLEKRPVDFFLLNYNKDARPDFHRTLMALGDWKLVYFDDLAVIYLKKLPKFARLIERDGYALLNPALPADAPDSGAVERRLMEATRATAAAPHSWRAWHFRARALIALNRLQEAEATEQRILQIHPESFTAWADLGNLYLLTGRKDQAEHAFAQCLELCPDCAPCRSGLDLTRGRSTK